MIDCVSYILLDSPRFIDLYAKRPESNPICPNLVTKKIEFAVHHRTEHFAETRYLARAALNLI